VKKLAFLVLRNNELKLILPLMKEVLNRTDVESILITSTSINTAKASQDYQANVNPFHKQLIGIKDEKEIFSVVKNQHIDVLITSSILIDVFSELKEHTHIAYLQHSTDLVSIWPFIYDKDFFQLFDSFFCFSLYWKNKMVQELETSGKFNRTELERIRERIYIVGFPELDQVKEFNETAIREKYGLAHDKKILFFDPTGVVNHVPNFFYKYYFCLYGSIRFKLKQILIKLIGDTRQQVKSLWKFPYYLFKIFRKHRLLPNYENIFLKLKQYCHEHDMLLICKSRPKNNDPEWIKKGCDLYCYDEGYLPFTLLELLYISNAYVGFNSTSVMEGAYCNLPAIVFQIFPTEFQYRDYGGKVYQYLESCLERPGEWLNYSGVIDVSLWDESKESVFAGLDDQSINPEARREYVKTFLGFDDGKSSKRVIDTVIDHFL
jgi:hypothetical protein